MPSIPTAKHHSGDPEVCVAGCLLSRCGCVARYPHGSSLRGRGGAGGAVHWMTVFVYTSVACGVSAVGGVVRRHRVFQKVLTRTDRCWTRM